MKKRRPETQPIDPAELAADYLFPELFADAPFSLISQEAIERPFAPSAAVQHTIPDLPPVDWEHIRKKDAARRRQRRARRSTSKPRVRPLVFVPPLKHQTRTAGHEHKKNCIVRLLYAVARCLILL